MLLNELPDDVLREICLQLNADDIRSLQNTSQRFSRHIRANRLCYSKISASTIAIKLTNEGKRTVKIWYEKRPDERQTKILPASMDNIFNSFSPRRLESYDHNGVANQSILWWKQIKKIELTDIIDYRRYLPHLDRCTEITLKSHFPKNLTEILDHMEKKHLEVFSIEGHGELDCTDDDLRKLARLSNNMWYLKLESISETSNITGDAILDFFEFGSVANDLTLVVSRTPVDMTSCLNKRKWVAHSSQKELDGKTFFRFQTEDNREFYIQCLQKSINQNV